MDGQSGADVWKPLIKMFKGMFGVEMSQKFMKSAFVQLLSMVMDQ